MPANPKDKDDGSGTSAPTSSLTESDEKEDVKSPSVPEVAFSALTKKPAIGPR